VDAGAAARLAGALLRGGVPPELVELGLPGADSSGVWVRKGLCDTRSPPGTFAGLGEVRGGACCDGGGPARRGSPACGVLAVVVAYMLRELAQKRGEVGVCLTEGRLWVESQRRKAGGGIRAAVVAELAEGVAAGVLRVPGSRDSSRGVPAEVLWGSGRARGHRR
jgi:hypothetical protein